MSGVYRIYPSQQPKRFGAALLPPGGGTVVPPMRGLNAAAQFQCRDRYPIQEPYGGIAAQLAPPPSSPFNFTGSRTPQIQQYARPDGRAMQPEPWLAAVEDTEIVVVGESTQPLAVHDRPRFPRVDTRIMGLAALNPQPAVFIPRAPALRFTPSVVPRIDVLQARRTEEPTPPPPGDSIPPTPIASIPRRSDERPRASFSALAAFASPLSIGFVPPRPLFLSTLVERPRPQTFIRIAAFFYDQTAPGAPVQDDPTVIGNSQIDLNWQASSDSGGSGLAGYFVYRYGARITPFPVSGLTYSVTGLSAGTSYAFEITAVDKAGNESARSNVKLASTTGGGSTGLLIARRRWKRY